MDIDERNPTLRFTYSTGGQKTFTFSGYGNNSVQRVVCNQYNVVLLEVILPGTGGITEINFCPECN